MHVTYLSRLRLLLPLRHFLRAAAESRSWWSWYRECAASSSFPAGCCCLYYWRPRLLCLYIEVVNKLQRFNPFPFPSLSYPARPRGDACG